MCLTLRYAEASSPLIEGDLVVVVCVTIFKEGNQTMFHVLQGCSDVHQLATGHESEI